MASEDDVTLSLVTEQDDKNGNIEQPQPGESSKGGETANDDDESTPGFATIIDGPEAMQDKKPETEMKPAAAAGEESDGKKEKTTSETQLVKKASMEVSMTEGAGAVGGVVVINEIHFQAGDKFEVALVPTNCSSDEIKGKDNQKKMRRHLLFTLFCCTGQ